MKLSHLKNIIRKTLKEANLLTEIHKCNCPGLGYTECTNPCASGCCPGGTDWEGEVAPDTSTDPIGTGDFAKNTPRAINVRPTTLTEDENTTMKLSQLKNIIKEEVKNLNEASRAQRPDWFPPHPDVPSGEYGHMPLEGEQKPLLTEAPTCSCCGKWPAGAAIAECQKTGCSFVSNTVDGKKDGPACESGVTVECVPCGKGGIGTIGLAHDMGAQEPPMEFPG